MSSITVRRNIQDEEDPSSYYSDDTIQAEKESRSSLLPNNNKQTHHFYLMRKMRYYIIILCVSFFFIWGQTSMKLTTTLDEVQQQQQQQQQTFTFDLERHPLQRSDRFPSVEDRVKLYMSNFYLPPCMTTGDNHHTSDTIIHRSNNTQNEALDERDERLRFINNFPRSVTIMTYNNRTVGTFPTRVYPDNMLVLNEDALRSCSSVQSYCSDAMKIVSSVKTMTGRKSLNKRPPILAQFGDDESKNREISMPSLHKIRHAATKSEVERVTNPKSGVNCTAAFTNDMRKKLVTIKGKDEFSPIIWPLNYDRHFGLVPSVKKLDTPWEQKKNEAVWRGVMTGYLSNEQKRQQSFNENCNLLPRCCFVRDYWNTTGFNVGFSRQTAQNKINDDYVYMIKDELELSSLMKYKVIVIIEGNDVSSGLKWALYSGSVVMMAPPTKTSYAMEELLIPWVHYVPLKPDFSDASEKLNWVLSHDDEARRIAERATLFIHDLLFHEDSEEDNRRIREEILSRYMKFFVWE